MRTIPYILFFLFTVLSCPAQELLSDYRGMVYVRENSIEQQGDNLMLNLQIDLSGLSVGRYQSLAIAPMLREGRDSLKLQPIVVNGANKQKMYERTLAFKGKVVADDGGYLVVKNQPTLLREVTYRMAVPFESWMKGAELVLVGELKNYDGVTKEVYINILTDNLIFLCAVCQNVLVPALGKCGSLH